jgi:peptidoglycan hydrolase CwlO-like protein
MKKIVFSVLCVLMVSGLAMAQSDKPAQQTSKGDDYFKGYQYKDQKANKKLKKRTAGRNSVSVYYDKKIEEYRERMKDNAARYKKMSKEMKKPQYSDPTYFGHKNPPKKRPVGKKKFCSVCEIVH